MSMNFLKVERAPPSHSSNLHARFPPHGGYSVSTGPSPAIFQSPVPSPASRSLNAGPEPRPSGIGFNSLQARMFIHFRFWSPGGGERGHAKLRLRSSVIAVFRNGFHRGNIQAPREIPGRTQPGGGRIFPLPGPPSPGGPRSRSSRKELSMLRQTAFCLAFHQIVVTFRLFSLAPTPVKAGKPRAETAAGEGDRLRFFCD